MKLFFKSRNAAAAPENTFELAPATAKPAPVSAVVQISLSAEQKELLDQPVSARVTRIMDQIYADKAAAERALNSRQIVSFPAADTGERHVVQDADGFWRIVPGPAPKAQSRLFDAL